jgi:hypothetical protein
VLDDEVGFVARLTGLQKQQQNDEQIPEMKHGTWFW